MNNYLNQGNFFPQMNQNNINVNFGYVKRMSMDQMMNNFNIQKETNCTSSINRINSMNNKKNMNNMNYMNNNMNLMNNNMNVINNMNVMNNMNLMNNNMNAMNNMNVMNNMNCMNNNMNAMNNMNCMNNNMNAMNNMNVMNNMNAMNNNMNAMNNNMNAMNNNMNAMNNMNVVNNNNMNNINNNHFRSSTKEPPPEIIPRIKKLIEIKEKNNVSNQNKIINVLLVASSGTRVLISAPTDISLYKLLCQYVQRLGIGEGNLGTQIFFLFNCKYLDSKDRRPLNQVFKNVEGQPVITVVDLNNVIGAQIFNIY